MKIAIDGMGGDHAPLEIVKGAVAAAREYGTGIILVGPEEVMKQELTRYDCSALDIEIVHTDEYLIEGEQPALALRKKRNASIAVATRLVKEGKADAVVGAGPTGGVVVAALQYLGTVEGISRPVTGGAFLGFAPQTLMMDLGGNVDCKPEQLLDFAVVGTVYARKMFGIANPTVAILSNGAEEGKGNQQVKDTYPLLKESGLNYIGNVEGYDIPYGRANVIICDGFVGNITVKCCEALGKNICRWMEDKLAGKIAEGELSAMVNELYRATNMADTNGGGTLWAVNGVACVAHGRCKAPEITGVIGQAKAAVESNIVEAVKQELAAYRQRSLQRKEE